MAEVTLAEIRAAVRFRGDYQNTRKFSNADLNREIQKSFAEFYEIVADANEGWWDTSANVATVASQAYVALPTGAWRVQGVDRYDGGEWEAIRQVSRDARHRYSSSTDKPTAFRLTARGIELYPTPDTVYTLRVLYVPIAPSLSESQPREWYNAWDDYVIVSTLLKLDTREGKPLNDRITVLTAIEGRVRAGASNREQQEPDYLVIREGAPSRDTWGGGEF
jgi:hypothetical protein